MTKNDHGWLVINDDGMTQDIFCDNKVEDDKFPLCWHKDNEMQFCDRQFCPLIIKI